LIIQHFCFTTAFSIPRYWHRRAGIKAAMPLQSRVQVRIWWHMTAGHWFGSVLF